jgi:hypothetical protein
MQPLPHTIIPAHTVLGLARSTARDEAQNPQSPDAELLRLCDQFHQVHEQAQSELDPAERERVTDRWHELVEAIRRQPASTLAGLQAKAETYQPVHRTLTGDDAQDFTVLVEVGLARSLVLDVLRMRN